MTLATISQLGPYQVVSLLGSGSMGEVYRARDTRLDREVAIKVIRSTDSSEDVRRRFLQEARAVSALNHPNIVTIHDVGEEAGILYIVTEYIDGAPLRDSIRHGPLPQRTVLEFGSQIASGLAAAHEAGIIHRDLKPENIMVTREGRAKILDFGIAKAVSPEMSALDATIGGNETAPGVVLGTAAYMSPEQARGGRVSFWSDQFSLGAILFEMTTGQSPFKRETGLQTLSAILMEEAPLLTQGSPAFQWLVKRCLHKEPDHRYASTAEVLRELQNIRARMTDTLAPVQEPNTTASEPVIAPVATDLPVAEPRQKDWLRPLWLCLLLLGAAAAGFLGSRLFPAHSVVDLPTGYRPLATGPGMDVDPAWSPDGRAVAYSSERSGVFQIFLRSLHSSAASQLTFLSEQCLSPFWAPDGSRIYFLGGPDLWSVSAAGGSPQKVVGNVKAAAISTDGETLAVLRQDPASGLVSFWTGSVRSLQLQRYSKPPFQADRFQLPAQLRFSPDGKHLGAWLSTEGASEFWLLAWPEGTARRALNSAVNTTSAPSFSWQADSRQLVFAASSHLWGADPTGNTVEPLSTGTGTEWTPSASQTSDSVVFAAAAFRYNLAVLPLSGGPARIESPTATIEAYPATSPSGDMAFVSTRSGGQEIWLHSNGTDRPLITASSFGDKEDGQQREFSHLAFSPDGRRLAYVRKDAMRAAIWLSAVTGESPIRLTPASGAEAQSAPTWAPDGNGLAYLSKRKGVPVIMVARIGGLDPPAVIAENSGTDPMWSPNGTAIATLNSSGGVLLLSPDGRSRKVLGSGTWLAHQWSKDGRSIYGIKRTAARSLLLTQLTVADRSEITISDLGTVPAAFAYAEALGLRPYRGLTFAADGKSLVSSVFMADSDIWLLERSK